MYLELTRDDALDPARALARCVESGAQSILLEESAAPPELFDLSSGLLGELLHKLTTYRIRLAGVVSDPGVHSARFQDFVREADTGAQFRFFATRERAIGWLESG